MLETVEDYIDERLTHSIHTSEVKSFKGCRRRWDWLFREYYYPKSTAKPLEFGIAYHKSMEILYEPMLWNRPREVVLEMAVQAFRERCKKQLALFEEYHGAADADVEKDYRDRMDMGEAMIRYHDEYILPEFRERFTPKKVEVSFEVPILDENGDVIWCTCKNCMARLHKWKHENMENPHEMPWRTRQRGLPLTYGGRVDCVMEDRDGRLWIFDWKTAAQLNDDRHEFLELDDQIDSYVWAFRQLGIDCAGFVYVEQRKADGAEPEPNKVVRLGRRYSVSKMGVSCSADMYIKTVSEYDSEAYQAGLYDEFIEYLQENNKLHAAYTLSRNDEQIACTGQIILDEARDMIDPQLRIYPNPGRFSCGFCAFRAPCLSANDGGDYQYGLDSMFDRRSYHYWEEQEASTESKGGQ